MKRITLLFYTCLICQALSGQSIPLEDLQKSSQTRYLAFYSQNDVYQYAFQADKYFTNGVHIAVSNPIFDNKFARAVLFKNKGDYKSEYSLALGQDMYTPTDISIAEVDSTDRPYCGLLYFTYTRNSNSIKIGRKVITRLFLGVQGPISGAGQTQTWLHERIDNSLPQGWHNQIANGLVLDYEIKQQKMLPIRARNWEVNANSLAHIGTIYNYAQAGLSARLGWFNSSYYHYDGLYDSRSVKGTYKMEDIRWMEKNKKKHPEKAKSRTTYINRDFQLYAFANFNFGYMVYDGTVQGSLIPFGKSPYTLKNSDIDGRYGNLTQGITLNYRSILVQYERVIKRDQFKGEGYYGWGQIRVSVSM